MATDDRERERGLAGLQVILAVALIYALGFVVANAHFARYQELRLELLQTRYLGAALLIMGTMGVPFILGGFVAASFMKAVSGAEKKHTRKPLSLALEIPLGVLGAIVFSLLISRVPGLTIGEPAYIAWAVQALVAFEAGRYLYPMWARWSRSSATTDSELDYRLYSANVSIVTVLSLLAIAFFYGRSLYPGVAPWYGGGAVWKGELYVNPGSQSIVDGPVIILDRNEGLINVLACVDRSSRQVRGLAISVDRVDAMRLDSLIRVPDSLSSVCDK